MNSLQKPAVDLMVMYAHYHRDRRNILTHVIGIPLIVLAIGLLLARPVWSVAGLPLSPAWVLWAVAAAWYARRGSAVLGWATIGLMAALMVAAHAWAHHLEASGSAWAPWMVGVAVFVVGWVFQFVGHYFEGRKPAFADDLVGLLVGPMFVVAEVLMTLGALSAMRQTIDAEAGPVR